ncbi:hypothetical protein NHQ30_001113 [Ciborinia camelliae]|nr:hypothetical protein NHQ30_001113 [Ciborinia camelliae]
MVDPTDTINMDLTRSYSNATMVPDNTYHSFPQFPKLPPEVRMLIWENAIPDPRIIILEPLSTSRCEHAMVRVRSDMLVPDRCQNDDYPGSNGTICTGTQGVLSQDFEDLDAVRRRIKSDDQFGFSSEAQVPVVLFVCKESYHIASKRYKQAFPSRGAFPEIYFDYERDHLFLPSRKLLQRFLRSSSIPMKPNLLLPPRSELCKVQNLVLSSCHYFRAASLGQRNMAIYTALMRFPNLKNLTIVVQDCRTGKTAGENSELVLFEPIIIHEALVMFNSPQTNSIDLNQGLLRENPQRLEMQVDVADLEGKRLEDLAKGFVWNLPNIQWKTLTTATFKNQFETSKKDYERRTGIICHRIHETDMFSIDPSKLLLHS